jgi:hypothetical protein
VEYIRNGGAVERLLGLIQESVPGLYRAFESMIFGEDSRAGDEAEIASIYDSIPSADFSKLVLSAASPRLTVFNLGDVGWSDLGEPQRLIETLSTQGIQNSWQQVWMQERAIASVAGQ